MCWLTVILVAALVGFMVWASADVASGVYLKMLCRLSKAEREVALTFDDGPDPVTTPRVLEVLRRYDARATFFLVGSQVERYPDLVREIVAAGHTVANHTYSHTARWTVASRADVEQELEWCRSAIKGATGVAVRLFRPPFGVTNPIIARAVSRGGYKAIGWSVRSLDTVTSRSREEVGERVVRSLRAGDVVLLHDRVEGAEQLVEMILRYTQGRGWRSVSVDELFNIDAYENE